MLPKMAPSAPETSTTSGHASKGPALAVTSGTHHSLRQEPAGELPEPIAPPEACILAHRLTGTAVQLSWELRAGGHGRRTSSTDVHFGQLEVLECLWPRATSEPEYTEVRTEEGLGSGASGQPGLVYLVCPHVDPELPQSLGLPSLLSTLCPPATHTDPAPGAQGNHCCPAKLPFSCSDLAITVV